MKKVLFILLALAVVLVSCDTSDDEPDNDIVEIVVQDTRFSTLETALQTAGLIETLQGEGPFTVFAPTDAAFDALPAGTLDSLLNDVDALQNVLLYHVVSGSVMSDEVVMLDSAATVSGESVTITSSGDTVMINDATVIQKDIEATNGVIHVIDAVLIPPTP